MSVFRLLSFVVFLGGWVGVGWVGLGWLVGLVGWDVGHFCFGVEGWHRI